MSSQFLPTTGAQVSGHRFLQRRVEHGLVFGDIRMIYDPLSVRRRAMVFGLVAVALLGLGSGLLAWLKPAADPGDSSILQTADGALFVKVGEVVHPVGNLASARLITGEAEEPARIADHLLVGLDRGAPLGIHPAPLVLAQSSDEQPWAACYHQEKVTVLSGEQTAPLGGHRGVIANGADSQWLLTNDGRSQLPPADTAQGRVIRRALAITAGTPSWEPPVEVLGAVEELPPLRLPSVMPEEIFDTGTQSWARGPEGIAPLTQTQAMILADSGVPVSTVSRSVPAEHADSFFEHDLPAFAPMWVDPAEISICAEGSGQVSTLMPATEGLAPVELPGESVADEFIGLPEGATAVDTGFGFHIVDTTGLRHPVPDSESLSALGVPDPVAAPWAILRLLPEGLPLDRGTALTAGY
ncbi:type VII secretion protein EccB [Corynebacterium alimapuense]|uniref:type VII secretion protein EccB n=1 Tax=Corynebacterium alimapuense TaxID=1576874 RepID=UPI001401FCFC|nr:type VII secretion protein EccB [Corynebacterium alimapuense]